MLRDHPDLITAMRRDDDAWIRLAASAAFDVHRVHGAYVSYDGRGAIAVAPYDDLDPDDCLAQIILHELCHFAAEGPASRHLADWGLDNTDDRHVDREHLALWVQRALVDPHRLADVLAPTTDFRPWYDAHLDAPVPPAAVDIAAALRATPLGRAIDQQLAAIGGTVDQYLAHIGTAGAPFLRHRQSRR